MCIFNGNLWKIRVPMKSKSSLFLKKTTHVDRWVRYRIYRAMFAARCINFVGNFSNIFPQFSFSNK